MSLIEFESKGSFKQTEAFLESVSKAQMFANLDKFGEKGVKALASATPIDTGKTSNSWYYEVDHTHGSYSITWHNSNIEDNNVIAILIQYGHGTGTGGYVQGRDYINPAIKPIFDEIAADVWKVVKTR